MGKYNPQNDRALQSLISMETKMKRAEKKQKNGTESFSDVRELLGVAKDQLQVKEDMTKEWLTERDINVESMKALYNLIGPDYTVTDDNEIRRHFQMISGEKTASFLDEYETDPEESRYSLMKCMIQDVFHEWKDLQDDVKTITDIEKDYEKEVSTYSDYLSSEEYDKDQRSKIKTLSELLSGEAGKKLSSSEVRGVKREILVLTQRYSLEYLYERLNDSKIGQKEVRNIAESYFDRNKSAYIMKRFHDRCAQMGLSPDVPQHLLNLEEGFLEPEFHVFNNLYLFFIMRIIAYGDVTVSRELKQPVRCMLNLVYHKFYADEPRETFLNSMRGFLRRFEEYREVFNEKNILHPGHPHRIKRDAEMAAMKKAEIALAIGKEFPEVEVSSKMSYQEVSELYDKLCKERAEREKAEMEDPCKYLSEIHREMLHDYGWEDDKFGTYARILIAKNDGKFHAFEIDELAESIIHTEAGFADKMKELTGGNSNINHVVVVRDPVNAAEYAEMIAELNAVQVDDVLGVVVPENAKYIVAKTPEIEQLATVSDEPNEIEKQKIEENLKHSGMSESAASGIAGNLKKEEPTLNCEHESDKQKVIGRGLTTPIMFNAIETVEDLKYLIHQEFPEADIPDGTLEELEVIYTELCEDRNMVNNMEASEESSADSDTTSVRIVEDSFQMNAEVAKNSD